MKNQRKSTLTRHECEYYSGKIGDVTVLTSDNTIYCRRCAGKLLDSQVEPKMLKRINKENRHKK